MPSPAPFSNMALEKCSHIKSLHVLEATNERHQRNDKELFMGLWSLLLVAFCPPSLPFLSFFLCSFLSSSSPLPHLQFLRSTGSCVVRPELPRRRDFDARALHRQTPEQWAGPRNGRGPRGSVGVLLGAKGIATRNKCIASSNKCLTTSNNNAMHQEALWNDARHQWVISSITVTSRHLSAP